jgi:hypothetical protein
MDILSLVTKNLAGGAISDMASKVGLSNDQANSAVSTMLPTLLGALQKNASTPEGAEALNNALDKHDGSIFDNLSDMFAPSKQEDGSKIVNHIFGDRTGLMQEGLAKFMDTDTQKSSSLLSMLAPAVMGAMGKAKKEEGFDASGLTAMLTGQTEQMKADDGEKMTLVQRLMDMDNDGSYMDDLAGMAWQGFKRMF